MSDQGVSQEAGASGGSTFNKLTLPCCVVGSWTIRAVRAFAPGVCAGGLVWEDRKLRTGRLFSTAVVAAVALATPVFGSLVVDGNLSDWGVVVADNNLSTYNLSPGLTLLGSMVEDQDDHAGDGGFLGPEYGGQKYDAEMMAVAYQGGRIYMAIVTGQRPSNGLERFAPGDIRIETNGIVYGIEVGGGTGGGSGTMISGGASGSTYTLNGNGYTTGAANADAAQTAGSIWSNATWTNSTVLPIPTQFSINGSSVHVADADYRYTRDSVTTQHAIIELSFDASLIGAGHSVAFAWRPTCANDELVVNGLVPVPEPATLLLLLAGGVFLRKR